MTNYICIDGGTTNTRISLVCDNVVIDTMKFKVGAKDSVASFVGLKETVKYGINEMLLRHHLQESDINRILASGMITSDLGLICLEHIPVPAGCMELHKTMVEKTFPDISSIPFVFIRGVKILGEDLETTDMMRGEETELTGLFEGEGTYILPGSHSKIIKMDGKGRIVDFKTMLTGEMIAALAEHTILKDAIDFNEVCLDEVYLTKGYRYCEENGINEALFKVRILKNLFGKNPSQIYNFYMGVILCSEIQYIIAEQPKKIWIGGKKQIKEAMALLLKSVASIEVITIEDEKVETSTVSGAIKVYEL